MKNIDETISIPEKYINNYDDFERLDLSNKVIEIYKTLNKISLDVNKEVIKVLYKDGESDYIISELPDKVYIPKYVKCMKDLCIYHSHTYVTRLSRRDMIKLHDKNIKKIGCITSNGDIFEIEIGNGYIPDDYDETCLFIVFTIIYVKKFVLNLMKNIHFQKDVLI